MHFKLNKVCGYELKSGGLASQAIVAGALRSGSPACAGESGIVN